MLPASGSNLIVTNSPHLSPIIAPALTVELLAANHEAEVMAFLAERPADTFGLAGFIKSNGLVSPHNRGEFYACRDEEGELEGVALIGHSTLFAARSEAAIATFARLAQNCPDLHMVLGEENDVETFWYYFSDGGPTPRRSCRELLFEQRWPIRVEDAVPGLRAAVLDDLDLVVPPHTQSVKEESGVDPLQVDAVGFRLRCARRIEQGRTWVLLENGKLIFKAEVVSDTPDVIYLEGVWVAPEERGKGYGLRCLSQLSRTFLTRAKSVCLFVNEQNLPAQTFYRKVGFKLNSLYKTLFF